MRSAVKKLACAAVLGAAYLSTVALAPPVFGSSVSVTGDYPSITSPITNSLMGTVPATFTSTEFTVEPGFFLFGVTIDVNANSIELLYNGSPGGTALGGSGVFTGYVFDFTGAPTITGASLDTTLSTFTAAQIPVAVIGGDEITVNGAGQTFGAGSEIYIDVTTATTSPVPEPSSLVLVLLGSGLLGVAGFVRRRIA